MIEKNQSGAQSADGENITNLDEHILALVGGGSGEVVWF